jgi:hypothetical protein
VTRPFSHDVHHVTQDVVDTSVTEIHTRELVCAIADGTLTEDCAWHAFLQLVHSSGLRSGVCRAWILALTRRAAGL